jgi:RimJ/RimL family protein N-acetyltransferase
MLRPFQASDASALYAIQSDAQSMRYTFVATSLQHYSERLRVFESSRTQQRLAPWVVLDRSDTRVIGWGGLNIDPFDPGWGVEVSYFFDPAHWGHGYATELVAYSLQHAFIDLDLPDVTAFAMPENVGSIRVLTKCGFSLVGYEPRLVRNHYRIVSSQYAAAASLTPPL